MKLREGNVFTPVNLFTGGGGMCGRGGVRGEGGMHGEGRHAWGPAWRGGGGDVMRGRGHAWQARFSI